MVRRAHNPRMETSWSTITWVVGGDDCGSSPVICAICTFVFSHPLCRLIGPGLFEIMSVARASLILAAFCHLKFMSGFICPKLLPAFVHPLIEKIRVPLASCARLMQLITFHMSDNVTLLQLIFRHRRGPNIRTETM